MMQHASTIMLEASIWPFIGFLLAASPLAYLPRLHDLAAWHLLAPTAVYVHRMGSTRPTRTEMGLAMAEAVVATIPAMGLAKGSPLPRASLRSWQMYSSRLVLHPSQCCTFAVISICTKVICCLLCTGPVACA